MAIKAKILISDFLLLFKKGDKSKLHFHQVLVIWCTLANVFLTLRLDFLPASKQCLLRCDCLIETMLQTENQKAQVIYIMSCPCPTMLYISKCRIWICFLGLQIMRTIFGRWNPNFLLKKKNIYIYIVLLKLNGRRRGFPSHASTVGSYWSNRMSLGLLACVSWKTNPHKERTEAKS